jgi:uncharacterized repeat protein (TIGR01451 family)
MGRKNGSDHLKLAIGLPLRNQDELRTLLQELYDPSSPNYHHYLTPEEFTARFGPTEEDYQAVRRYAEDNGFTVTATHLNRVVLDVDAAVTDIERTLHLEMRNFQHPTEGRIFHAPSAEPIVDLAVPVLHISGLDDYSLPHPKSKPRPATVEANATPKSGSGPGGAYRGSDFRTAYAVGPLTGVGQSVGLLQFDGYYASDIAAYASQAGIPPITLTNVPIDGGVSTPGSGNSEVALDIEMVMSMAPGLSKIIVYEAPNPSPFVDLLSRMANDNLAKQLSCSWGGGGTDPTSEQVFQQMVAQGQSFFNASGDSDAFTSAIEFPSESTNVTQVGGTTLSTTGPGGSYVSETVWNWGLTSGSYVGSSGGVSTHYLIPPYQTGISMTANLGSTTMRNVPDVAMTGDNVYVIYNNGTTGNFGGTSCAAPLWAGFTALMNQQAAAGGQPPVGFLNPAIYAIGKSNPNYASLFHDVTTGNNFSSSSPSKFPATVGYDLCTGWGSPNGTNLMNVLTTPVYIPVITSAGTTLVAESCFPTNGAIDSGETVTVNVALKNVGSANSTNLVVTMLATNGAGSPNGPQNYGVLTQGGAAVTRPFTFTALGSCGGVAAVTLQLQDGAANLGTVTLNFTLGKLAPSYLENFDAASIFPSGWTTTGLPLWVITNSIRDTLPNSAFSAGAVTSEVNTLVTPPIAVPPGMASQLSFRNNYNLEATASTAYDGGVLEIKIGPGSFTDILTAGGSFVAGGYNQTISRSFGNPLRGRRAWSGNSAGFISTIVNLPASAAGQNIQLRWSCGTDNSTASAGWYIDTVALSNIVCCAGSTADLALSNSVSPAALNLSSNVTFTLNVTNLGPNSATAVVVTDTLPAGFTFVTASVSQGSWSNSGNWVSASLGTVASQGKATVTVQAIGTAAGQWTNSATISSGTTESNPANNTAAVAASVNSPPTISGIADVFTAQDVATGPINFVIGDAETAVPSLVLSAASSDTNLIDAAHIVFGGSGANRTVTLTPRANQFGSCNITLGVSDGMASTNISFTFTVAAAPVNTPPTISGISDVVTAEDVPVGPIGFVIGDAETAPSSLELSASSSDTNLIDAAHIAFGGSGANRTVTFMPLTNRLGSCNITLGVSDGVASTNISFTFTVNPVNHPAILENVPDFVIFEKDTLQFTNKAADIDPSQTLTFSLTNAPAGASITSDTGILTWTPTELQGPSTNVMTVVVSDNGSPSLSASQNFSVVVLESNEPPVLAPLSDRTIHVGMSLVISNSATDADVPTNSLTYSLYPGPAGADINTTNGVFVWTPDSSFANTTNSVTVVVTDNNPDAVGQLNDAKSFNIFVAAAPTFSSAVMSNDVVTLTWSAISGLTYRVQYVTDLWDTAWKDLPPDVVATDTTASQTDSTTSDTQRFYRVMVVP